LHWPKFQEEEDVRSFVTAVMAMIILAVGFGYVLDLFQTPVSSDFSTEGARIAPEETRQSPFWR
jgi:hypothetical protein